MISSVKADILLFYFYDSNFAPSKSPARSILTVLAFPILGNTLIAATEILENRRSIHVGDFPLVDGPHGFIWRGCGVGADLEKLGRKSYAVRRWWSTLHLPKATGLAFRGCHLFYTWGA